MGIFTEEVPKTSVTHYIERLSNYEEIEWYTFQQLSEAILMQEGGPREAIEAIRKKLKHGTLQQKLGSLEILKLLMENSNQRFHKQLATNEKMMERFETILTSPTEDKVLKKTLLSILGAWSVKYKGEQGMSALIHLYETGRNRMGMRHRSSSTSTSSRPAVSTPTATTPTAAAPTAASTASISPPSPSPSPPSTVQKKRTLPPVKKILTQQSTQSTTSSTPTSPSSASTPTHVFNFAAAKPRILHEVAVSNQNANNLINALQLINTSQDRWEIDLQHDSRLQDTLQKCEESKKKIVRYARLVEDEEWIGTLLVTNEALLKALEMYEIMSVGQVPASMKSVHEVAEPQRFLITDSAYDHDSLDPFADPVDPVREIP
ncbi:hypothetical protein BDF14DRAFT_1750589 [Spinellus fusiger]|nr:hypothetical protein BDF14DRAFT_1750589 [Spinellus fusiger]